MKLSKENYRILLTELNKTIEESADFSAENINNGKITSELSYPPNNGFSSKEIDELEKLKNNQTLKSALRKVLADCNASVMFNFLNLIDGTTDPSLEPWNERGVVLVDSDDSFEENIDMLHDGLYDKYWEWRKLRKKDWKLDTLKD